MRKTIRLWNDGRCWLAEYDGEEAEEIRKLMGTTTIPTAYTIGMPKDEVINNLMVLNPDHEVI